MAQRDQITAANRRAKEMLAAVPRAVVARYDKRAGRVVIELNTRLHLAFAPQDVEGLECATAAQLTPIQVSPSGFGIYFPKLDADVYVPALLEGLLGSKRWMASRLGRSGGSVKSASKAAAARKNGRLGGRPKRKIGVAA